MNGAFYIGATGLSAAERAMSVIANNVTNINTTAYKRSEVVFSALVADSGSNSGTPLTPTDPSSLVSGVSLSGTPIDFTEGPLQATGQPLDLAIDGPGFIELMGPGGQTMLWRGGTLQINSDGNLAAASNGMPLKAMISVPSGTTALSIGQDGKVTATVNGETTPSVIGQIDLVTDKDISSLTPVSGGLYAAENDSDLVSNAPGQDGAGVLASGTLEGSNVQLSDELTTMLLLERAYGANAQVVQAGDQLMAIANGLKR